MSQSHLRSATCRSHMLMSICGVCERRRDTAATMIQKVAKTFIVKRRLATVRSRIKAQLVMTDLKSIKESTKFPMITLKH